MNKERFYIIGIEESSIRWWEEDISKEKAVESITRTLRDYIDVFSKLFEPSTILEWIDKLNGDKEKDFAYGIFDKLQERVRFVENLILKSIEVGAYDELHKCLYGYIDNIPYIKDEWDIRLFPLNESLFMNGDYTKYLHNLIYQKNESLGDKLFDSESEKQARKEEIKKRISNYEKQIEDYKKAIQIFKQRLKELNKEVEVDD